MNVTGRGVLPSMKRASLRLVLATLVAGTAGVLTGVQLNLDIILTELFEMEPETTVGIALLVAVVVVGLNPLGTFLAGYFWGVAADVAAGYYRLFSATLMAALIGFVLAFSLSSVPVVLPGETVRIDFVIIDAIVGLSVVTAAFSALAGGTFGHFWSERANL